MAFPGQDQSVFGPFPKAKFLNASVVSFSATSAWAEQSTLFNCQLVNDPIDGDDFLLTEGNAQYDGGGWMGAPISFSYSGFRFDGIIKQVSQVNDPQTGNPIFNVTMATPVEVLAGTQVILAGYVGPNNDSIFNSTPQGTHTFAVGNLINVYGFGEAGGADFGRSLATDIGLPWINNGFGISEAIQILTNIDPSTITDPTKNYGSYINYKGYYYRVDLSNLPAPPSFYRIGGAVNMTLLELISVYMESAGLDYMVRLTVNPNNAKGPHTISFITIARFIQQPLGQIAQYIAGQQNIATVSRGQELRSDITQAFLIGGAVNFMETLQNLNGTNLTITPFFGFDSNGNPIIGSKPDGTQYADDDFSMNLNASPVADIVGELGLGLSYPSTILEMRCALGGYDTWVAYLKRFQPNIATGLSLYGAFDNDDAPNAQTIFDLQNDDPGFVIQLGDMWSQNHWPAVSQRLYEFVREIANTYYGKKFVVRLPFQVQVKIDPSTGETSFNSEIADAGFAPEGSNLLGLNFVNENFFLDQTGRFYPFCEFSFTNTFNSIAGQKLVNANVSYLNGSAAVVQFDNNPQLSKIFTRCEQGEASPVLQNGQIGGGSQIIFVPNGIGVVSPAMIVTTPDAIWAQGDDILGSATDVAALLQMSLPVLQNILSLRSTSVDFVIHPPALYPNGIAVAFNSSQYVYGPWGKFNVNGKLEFEQDAGLVPWEYGGYAQMNLAAIAKLNNIAMGNQVLERGNFSEAGLPRASLGERLDGGPILLTEIVCDISPNQVMTNYVMETFVNRVGVFINENQERLKRVGKIYQQLRRTIRQLVISTNQQTSIYNQNYKGYMFGTTYAVEQHTPHSVIGGNVTMGADGSFIPQVFTQTPQESLANIGRGSGVLFQSSACVSLDAIFRPYTMQQDKPFLSPYLAPDSGYNSTNLITSKNLNPLVEGCDINWLVSGNDVYTGMKASKNAVDYTSARSIALSMPIIQAWGYDIAGNPVPNSFTQVGHASMPHGIFAGDYSGSQESTDEYYGNIYGSDEFGDLQEIWDEGSTDNPDPEDPAAATYTEPNPYNLLQNQTDIFFSGYLNQSIYWPTGPLDLRWNKFTGTWMSLGTVLTGEISGSTNMIIYVNEQPTGEYIPVSTFVGAPPDGTKVIAAYNALSNKWEIVSSACFTS